MSFPSRNFGVISGIYMIKCVKSNKFYIGSSKDIYHRWLKHRAILRKNNHFNQTLQNVWNKYGEINFDWSIIYTCGQNELIINEQHFIDLLNPYCNITRDVVLCATTESQKKKISETLKRKYASGEILPTRTTEVYVYDLEGNFINNFISVSECSRQLNIKLSKISKCLRKDNNQHKGLQFKYLGEDPINLFNVKRRKITKAVFDLKNNIKYNCLIDACKKLNLSYYDVRIKIIKNDFFENKEVKLIRACKLGEFRETPEVDNPELSL